MPSRRLDKEEKRQAKSVRTESLAPKKNKVPPEGEENINSNKDEDVLDMDKLEEDEEEQAEDAETSGA